MSDGDDCSKEESAVKRTKEGNLEFEKNMNITRWKEKENNTRKEKKKEITREKKRKILWGKAEVEELFVTCTYKGTRAMDYEMTILKQEGRFDSVEII